MKNGEEDEEGVNDEGHDVGERREGERHDDAVIGSLEMWTMILLCKSLS